MSYTENEKLMFQEIYNNTIDETNLVDTKNRTSIGKLIPNTLYLYTLGRLKGLAKFIRIDERDGGYAVIQEVTDLNGNINEQPIDSAIGIGNGEMERYKFYKTTFQGGCKGGGRKRKPKRKRTMKRNRKSSRSLKGKKTGKTNKKRKLFI